MLTSAGNGIYNKSDGKRTKEKTLLFKNLTDLGAMVKNKRTKIS